eukprot:TRINITY_DN114562_c0_g1_i1.p1 TRINITY_DN114562_c0_g1~~TRINITY_DN114562_c0_g1_i1.p1  ORF type:complete len:471 (-),score=60.52 TRINITY_DN114562_c0_g1_i1:49-1461(-)
MVRVTLPRLDHEMTLAGLPPPRPRRQRRRLIVCLLCAMIAAIVAEGTGKLESLQQLTWNQIAFLLSVLLIGCMITLGVLQIHRPFSHAAQTKFHQEEEGAQGALPMTYEKVARRCCEVQPFYRLFRGPAGGAILVAAYIAGDLMTFVAVGHATVGYNSEAALASAAFVSLSIGLGLSIYFDGLREGIVQVFVVRSWLPLVPVSGCFAVSTWCQLQAVALLSPMLVKVLWQLKLPCTVLLSALVLGRRYSCMQLQTLLTIFLAVTLLTFVKVENMANNHPQTDGTGYSAVTLGCAASILAICLNVLASILAEKALVDRAKTTPFVQTVAHLKIGEFMVACVLMVVTAKSRGYPSSMLQLFFEFTRFDLSVWCVIIALVMDSWTTALLVKRLSSVAKAVAKCTSLVILYGFSILLKSEQLCVKQLLLALLVAQATLAFTCASQSQAAKERNEEEEQARSLRTNSAPARWTNC